MSFWSLDYTGRPFAFLGGAHLVALGLVLALNLLFVVWSRGASPKTRVVFRYTAAGLLLANEAVWHVWNWSTGQWSVRTMLPLHLCSVMVYVSAAALVWKREWLYEPLYFLGISGAFQALLTPDVGRFGFPHYRFFQCFLSHGLIVSAPVYLTLVEGLRPTWASFRRTILAGNLYLVGVGAVNAIVGGNYLFIARKPETASLLDVLGPWPWYIVGMEALGLLCMAILYLPFALKDRGGLPHWR